MTNSSRLQTGATDHQEPALLSFQLPFLERESFSLQKGRWSLRWVFLPEQVKLLFLILMQNDVSVFLLHRPFLKSLLRPESEHRKPYACYLTKDTWGNKNSREDEDNLILWFPSEFNICLFCCRCTCFECCALLALLRLLLAKMEDRCWYEAAF
jgi:hypothetical protein